MPHENRIIFQNLTPVQLKIAKSETFDLFDYNSKNYTSQICKTIHFLIPYVKRNALVRVLKNKIKFEI